MAAMCMEMSPIWRYRPEMAAMSALRASVGIVVSVGCRAVVTMAALVTVGVEESTGAQRRWWRRWGNDSGGGRSRTGHG